MGTGGLDTGSTRRCGGGVVVWVTVGHVDPDPGEWFVLVKTGSLVKLRGSDVVPKRSQVDLDTILVACYRLEGKGTLSFILTFTLPSTTNVLTVRGSAHRPTVRYRYTRGKERRAAKVRPCVGRRREVPTGSREGGLAPRFFRVPTESSSSRGSGVSRSVLHCPFTLPLCSRGVLRSSERPYVRDDFRQRLVHNFPTS